MNDDGLVVPMWPGGSQQQIQEMVRLVCGRPETLTLPFDLRCFGKTSMLLMGTAFEHEPMRSRFVLPEQVD